jgi:hypothetical protein
MPISVCPEVIQGQLGKPCPLNGLKMGRFDIFPPSDISATFTDSAFAAQFLLQACGRIHFTRDDSVWYSNSIVVAIAAI